MSFRTKDLREKRILKLVHNGVLGLALVPSLAGSMYYVYFIDEFSRMTWLYFINKKSKGFEKFLEFKVLVENKTNQKIKVLRIDNGGEFCGKAFDHFCRQHGIS